MTGRHTKFLSLVTGCVLIAMTGCTTLGPDFETPEAPVADEWAQEPTSPELGDQDGDGPDETDAVWWQLLDDPVLNDLVEQAYRDNFTLQAAGLRILAARSQLGIAIGQQYPQTQAIGGSTNRTWNESGVPNIDDTFTRSSIGFDVAWEIDFWGRARRGVESATAGFGASVANYDDALVSLTGEVARVYVTIRTLEERMRIANENVARQQRSYQIANVRFQAGAVTELDPSQARTLLRQTESKVYALQIQNQQAKHALAVLLGLPPQDLNTLLSGSGQIPTPPETIAVGIPADLLRRRPDIRAAELHAAAQSAQVGVAVTDLFPRFDLLGSVGYLTNTISGTPGDGGTGIANVGGSLLWPVFNYGRLKNNVRLQDARLEETLILYRDTVLKAAREVEDGLAAFEGNKQQAVLLGDGVLAAERAASLSMIQYRNGAVDYQRVLDSQSRLAAVQDSHVAARGNVVLSLVTTYKALGGGWQIRSGNDVVPEEIQERMRERTDWGKLLPQKVPEELPEPPPTGNKQPVLNAPDW